MDGEEGIESLTRPEGLEYAPMGPSRQRRLAGMEEWWSRREEGVNVGGFYS